MNYNPVFHEILAVQKVVGPNLTASNAATSIMDPPFKVILPAGFFSVGKALKLFVTGQLGNIVTTPGTLTIDFRLGAVIVWTSGAMQLSSTAHTALPFWLDVALTCRAIGNSTNANLAGQGRMTAQSLSLTAVADSTTTPATLLLPNTTPAVGTGFDSSATQQIDCFATFSLNNANAIQTHQAYLEG